MNVCSENRIGPAADSPRAAARYPYRPRPGHPEDAEAIRAEAGQIIVGIRGMIVNIITRLHPSAQAADRDDLAAIAAAHVLLRLPRYEVTRGAKLSTFLHRVVWSRLLDERRGRRRRAKREPELQLIAEAVPAAPLRPDVDRRAEAIANDPRGAGGLTKRQGQALDACTTTTRPLFEVAAELGLKRQNSLSMIRRRCHDRIADRDIEDFPDRPPPANALNFQRLTGFDLAEASRREGELMQTLPPAEASLISLLIEQSNLDVPGIARRLGVDANFIKKKLKTLQACA